MNQKTYNAGGGYSSHNSIKLIRGGAPYFDLMEKLIDEAKESIQLQTYIFEADETGTRIANALMRAAERGVTVHMMLDGYASRGLAPSLLNEIKRSGIHFRWFEPLFKSHNFYVGRRMHHKIFVTDARFSLVGGLNIGNRYNDMPDEDAWLDCAAFVDGQTSEELYIRCVQMWFRTKRQFRGVPKPHHSRNENFDCLIRMRINDWVRNKNQISRSYLEMFHKAQFQITIMSSYFLPGRIFRKNLRRVTQRGVKVRIVLTKISDVTLAKLAERFFYPWLLRRNIEIYEYRKKILHAKIASYDGHWVTVGSYNFNDLSAYASIELNLDVQNPGFSKQVDDALNEIIERDCDRISEEDLNHRTNVWNKIVYRTAYALIRFFLIVFTFNFKQKKDT